MSVCGSGLISRKRRRVSRSYAVFEKSLELDQSPSAVRTFPNDFYFLSNPRTPRAFLRLTRQVVRRPANRSLVKYYRKLLLNRPLAVSYCWARSLYDRTIKRSQPTVQCSVARRRWTCARASVACTHVSDDDKSTSDRHSESHFPDENRSLRRSRPLYCNSSRIRVLKCIHILRCSSSSLLLLFPHGKALKGCDHRRSAVRGYHCRSHIIYATNVGVGKKMVRYQLFIRRSGCCCCRRRIAFGKQTRLIDFRNVVWWRRRWKKNV